MDEFDVPTEDTRSLFGGPAARPGKEDKPTPRNGPATPRAEDDVTRDFTEREAVKRGIQENLHRRFSLMLTEAMTLAAHTHPDLLRAAIGTVFDVRFWREEVGRVSGEFSFLSQTAASVREQVMGLKDELRLLRGQQERIMHENDELRRKLEAIERATLERAGGQYRSPPPTE